MNPARPDSVVTLASLRFRGRDAAAFLHGQVSSDVLALRDGEQQLAGYHTPQGRVIALLRLTRVSREEVLVQLPVELAQPVARRLQRYVLRAQVSFEALDGAEWNATRSRPDDIAAGLPQIYCATSERFVAQMLNLDCIEALSFGKGCYTGQEVIARAHYRGRVKRRMQRFVTARPPDTPLQPGAALCMADGRRFEVIDAAARPDARVEFLAVGPLPGSREEPPAPAAGTAAESAPEGHDAPRRIDCETLPLPYALPD
ncbi:MAG: folate-binding protein YgfZ [Gammaproteobacteria bacterium]|nr:folate-binding protein YgfZ [Gammaproteobacteria bacterium]